MDDEQLQQRVRDIAADPKFVAVMRHDPTVRALFTLAREAVGLPLPPSAPITREYHTVHAITHEPWCPEVEQWPDRGHCSICDAMVSVLDDKVSVNGAEFVPTHGEG